jgi:hypothetical protein
VKKEYLTLILLSICNISLIGQAQIKEDSIVVNLRAAFVIDKNGEVTKIKIVETDCRRCDKEILKQVEQEVVRVIKSTPGLGLSKNSSERPTNQKYILPMRIILRDDN